MISFVRNFSKRLKGRTRYRAGLSGKDVGAAGESLAAVYLKKKGYRILATNFKTAIGEADIIARDREALVIVEVKTRRSLRYGRPYEAIGKDKLERLVKLAAIYARYNRLPECPVRIEAVSIILKGGIVSSVKLIRCL